MQLRRLEQANPVQRALRALVASRPGAWVGKRVLHRLDLVAHRLAPGRTTPSQWLAGVPVGLLTTTGARTGQPRTVPLMLAPLDEGWGVIASHYGSEQPPGWYSVSYTHLTLPTICSV